MRLGPWRTNLTPARAVELFVIANFAFLGGDIALAHLANRYAERAEWAPLLFSALAVPLLSLGALGLIGARWRSRVDLSVAWCAVLLGISGMLFHLSSGFFAEQTLRNLVYAAPFVAPLAYVGVGLLQLLVSMERADSDALGPWVLRLALGGVLGNLALSLLDHAQNGFFHLTEWLAVATSALCAGFLVVALVRPQRAFLQLCFWVCAAQAAVGGMGFVLHALADLHARDASWLDRLVFGAPLFAPLLFVNLSLLASIGLWALLRTIAQEETR
ncbi:MAG: hypothetical protein JWN04_4902 [Myxococcaceae bacterium]|nr:hypothetical protein [Myxococcaceae bacterium]